MDYPVFLASCTCQAMCEAHNDSFQVKSELPCKSQANEYLTISDIVSANRKVKIEIDT